MKRIVGLAVCFTMLAIVSTGCSGGGRLAVKGGGVGFLFALEHPGADGARAMENALRTRLEAAGMQGCRVAVEDNARIRVLVPGVSADKGDNVQALLTRPSRLAFSLVDEDNPFFEKLAGKLPGDGSVQWATETNPGGPDGLPHPSYYLTATNYSKLKKFLAGVSPPAGRRIGIMRGEWGLLAYLLLDPPALDRPLIEQARVIDGGPGDQDRVAVEIVLAARQRQAFARLTRENLHRRLAILVDGQIRSAPRIEAAIDSGRARIGASPMAPVAVAEREARSLAAGLMAWSLAGDLKLVKRCSTPATSP